MQMSYLYASDFPFKNFPKLAAQHAETIRKNVWEKSYDAYSLLIRVQTPINHISICFCHNINVKENVIYPDLSNRTVRQSNPIEHQSFDCQTQSNIIELTLKFCQSNTIERSITERLVIDPNLTFDYRTIGIIERSISERRIA